MSVLPRAARPFVSFPSLLRANGFAVAPEQTTTFLESIGLLGPKSIAQIRRAAHATLAPPPERRAAFDALFGAHFLGEMEGGEALGEPDDETVRVQEDRDGGFEPLLSDEVNEAGQDATAVEALSARRFGTESDFEVLRRFARAAPARMPRRPGHRRMRARRGDYFDTRRTLREAVRNDGDVMTLRRLKRRLRQRRVLLLIDVSGSMKERTEAHLRIAHALAHAVERIEVFTFGTRLTRVTRAMRLKNREQALGATSSIVSDWDGGTRIGDALRAFLSVPRFAGYSRGAMVLILSDGLERGDPAAMREAVTRLSRLAWRVSWLTPLAADPNFTPQTEGLKAILPLVDDLADGSSVGAVCAHVLNLGEGRMTDIVDAHHHIWRQADMPWLSGPIQPRIFGPYEPIQRNYLIGEFLEDIAGTGVVKSVYVQANWPKENFEDEVAWVSDVADTHGWPHGIVGYADVTVDDIRPQLDRLTKYPLMRGVRMQLHWHENETYRFAARPDLATEPTVQRNVARLSDYGWTFDLQVFAPQMAGAAQLAAACPKVTFVLQHAGMLEDLSAQGWSAWRAGMKELAAQPNVVSKTSALGTFIHRNDPEHIEAIVRETVAIFGADRTLFGSNFPIEKIWTSYEELADAHADAAAKLGEANARKLMHDTAMRVYRLA